jgi:hypothetical protein
MGSTSVKSSGFAPPVMPDTPVFWGPLGSTAFSVKLFHAPHSGQRPNQRGWVYPQAAQVYIVPFFIFFS